jgi:hypothetical protein
MEPLEKRPQFDQKSSPAPERAANFQAPERNETLKSREQSQEKQESKRGDTGKAAETAQKRSFNPLRRTPPIPQVKDELAIKIEKVLEKNIGEAYQLLSPAGKEAFKIRGEKTTNAIKELVQNGHVKTRTIVQLIIGWLKMLPGVNRFFIEQEAKIKTDQILKLRI